MHSDTGKTQGHWLLAKLGKRVLRPGGKELTMKLIDRLDINHKDSVVEFAPGLGFTAQITLKYAPLNYTAVELNKDAVAYLQNIIKGDNRKIAQGNANDTKLPSECATKVYGEAMLTMQSTKQKIDIIKEAHRILKKGGLYGIHEIALSDNISDEKREVIYRDLINAIKTNARPATGKEWEQLLINEGFKIKEVIYNPMHLVEPKRIIDDEGFFRALRIFINMILHPSAAKRVKQMRKVFNTHSNDMHAIAIVAEKL